MPVRPDPADAEECISYAVPGFKVAGKTVADFAAFKNHLSYLPHSGSVFPELAEELAGFGKSSGALRFAVDQPLPPELVEKLIALRLRQTFPQVPETELGVRARPPSRDTREARMPYSVGATPGSTSWTPTPARRRSGTAALPAPSLGPATRAPNPCAGDPRSSPTPRPYVAAVAPSRGGTPAPRLLGCTKPASACPSKGR